MAKKCKRCGETFKEFGGDVRRYYAYDICTGCQNKGSMFA